MGSSSMIHVDDLVEPRPEEIVLLTVPPLFRSFGRIESTSATLAEAKNHNPTRRSICKKSTRQRTLSCN